MYTNMFTLGSLIHLQNHIFRAAALRRWRRLFSAHYMPRPWGFIDLHLKDHWLDSVVETALRKELRNKGSDYCHGLYGGSGNA
jgi:hypothetical protein